MQTDQYLSQQNCRIRGKSCARFVSYHECGRTNILFIRALDTFRKYRLTTIRERPPTNTHDKRDMRMQLVDNSSVYPRLTWADRNLKRYYFAVPLCGAAIDGLKKPSAETRTMHVEVQNFAFQNTMQSAHAHSSYTYKCISPSRR
jgi:hypothetical protein